MRPSCYIELGLPHTPTIYGVAKWCGNVYAVDSGNSVPADRPNVRLFTMTTDRFFGEIAPGLSPPELVFIDADHFSGQVMKDLNNVAAICSENCVVVLHDTFPADDSYLAPELCNDSYLCPDLIAWEHVTLPVPPGLTLCRLKPKSLLSLQANKSGI
jgi:hypothetical protein